MLDEDPPAVRASELAGLEVLGIASTDHARGPVDVAVGVFARASTGARRSAIAALTAVL
jgi:hypothetical protein